MYTKKIVPKRKANFGDIHSIMSSTEQFLSDLRGPRNCCSKMVNFIMGHPVPTPENLVNSTILKWAMVGSASGWIN